MELDTQRQMPQLKKLSGKVKKNLGRGKTLGFPTANLDIDAADLESGVYAAYAEIKGKQMQSLVFIGVAETFGDAEKFVESYILDFAGDLYGEILKLELLKKLRDNRKFPSPADLVEQMKQDEQVARDFFKGYNKEN